MTVLQVRLLAVLLALASAACTPTRSTLRPPYELDGKQYDEQQIRAVAVKRCKSTNSTLPEHPYTTDGCSVWPDGVWLTCCIEHDVSYWCGGTAERRKLADEALRSCVRERHARFNAQIVYLGVRLWGQRLLPFPWRWGYGHDWPFRPESGQ